MTSSTESDIFPGQSVFHAVRIADFREWICKYTTCEKTVQTYAHTLIITKLHVKPTELNQISWSHYARPDKDEIHRGLGRALHSIPLLSPGRSFSHPPRDAKDPPPGCKEKGFTDADSIVGCVMSYASPGTHFFLQPPYFIVPHGSTSEDGSTHSLYKFVDSSVCKSAAIQKIHVASAAAQASRDVEARMADAVDCSTKRIRKLEDKIRDIEAENVANLEMMRKRCEEYMAQIKALEAEILKLRAANADCEEQREDFMDEIDDLRTENMEKQGEIEDLHEELRCNAAQIRQLEEELNDITEDRDILIDTIDEMEEHEKECNEEVDSLIGEYREEIEHLENEIDDKEGEHYLHLEAMEEDLRAEFGDVESRYEAQIEMIREEYEAQIDDLKAEHEAHLDAELDVIVREHDARMREMQTAHLREVGRLRQNQSAEPCGGSFSGAAGYGKAWE